MKSIKYLIILLVLITVVTLFILFRYNFFVNENHFATSANNNVENPEVINIDENDSINETIIEEPKTDEQKETTTSVTTPPKTNNKKSTSSKNTNKQNIESANNTNKEAKTKQEEKETSQIVKVKHICNNYDNGYISWLNDFKSVNKSSRVFYSKDSAVDFAENVGMKNGYGYFVNKAPITYSDEDCTIGIYAVRLYIPAKECEDNEMMYLNADDEVINVISYLRKIGYKCEGKVERSD